MSCGAFVDVLLAFCLVLLGVCEQFVQFLDLWVDLFEVLYLNICMGQGKKLI